MNEMTTTSEPITCPRCGNILGSWHTPAVCDAVYEEATRQMAPPDDDS